MGRACRRDMPCEGGNMSRTTEAAILKAGSEALKSQLQADYVAKQLEDAATRWDAQADAQPYAVGELKSYYRQKAANARARAKALREGKA
jgi:phosphodiesterase/alkaline phosphatase D-like protein